jgi:hypothetical protein
MLSRRQWYWIIIIFSSLSFLVTTYIIFSLNVDEIENAISSFFLLSLLFTSLVTMLSAGSLASYLSTPKVIRLPVSFKSLFFGHPIFALYLLMSLLVFVTFANFIIYQLVAEENQIYFSVAFKIFSNVLIIGFFYNILRMGLISLKKITRTGSVIKFFISVYKSYKAQKKAVSTVKQVFINSQIKSILRAGKVSSILAYGLKKEWESELKKQKHMLWLTYFMVAWCICFGAWNIYSAFMQTDYFHFTLLFICGLAMYLLIYIHYKSYKSEKDKIAEIQAKLDLL